MLNIPQADIDNYLENRTGPACAYLYDLASLEKHVRNLLAVMPKKCKLTYAIKANSDDKVLKTLAPLVGGFDVASFGEIEKVRNVSKDAMLALGGPAKTSDELKAAITHKTALFHIESMQQLQCLNEVVESMDQQVDVLLRINPDIVTPAATLQMGGASTQFGIEQAGVHDAITLSKTLPAIRLVGFHFHAISNNLDERKHLTLIEEYIHLVNAWKQQHNLSIRYINVGGGIGVNYADQRRQFDWPLFCSGLDLLLSRHKDKISPNTEIVFECGRFISAFCGFYLTEVIDIKNNHGHNFALLRGGSHHFRLPVSWQHNHPFRVIPRNNWPFKYEPIRLTHENVTLCGELCTPKDVLARNVFVDTLTQGDIILFLLAGAYGWHISHHDFLSHRYPDFIYIESV